MSGSGVESWMIGQGEETSLRLVGVGIGSWIPSLGWKSNPELGSRSGSTRDRVWESGCESESGPRSGLNP